MRITTSYFDIFLYLSVSDVLLAIGFNSFFLSFQRARIESTHSFLDHSSLDLVVKFCLLACFLFLLLGSISVL
jgi:hypothetical protein